MAATSKTTKYAPCDNTLENVINFHAKIPLDNGKHTCTPNHPLGTLEQLPLEITYMILLKLDIRSLTDFRRVSRRAMQVVDSIPQYKRIILHAPDTIRGSLSIGSAKFFTCRDLYEKLCTAKCDGCGKNGGYLYLVTCRRVCFDCFNESPRFLPLLQTDAQRKFGLSRKDLAALPQMKNVPGYFSKDRVKTGKRSTLIDHDAAREAGIAVHGSVSAMEEDAEETLAQQWKAYDRRMRAYFRGEADRNPREPKEEDSFDRGTHNPKRYMGIVYGPILDTTAGSPESVYSYYCDDSRLNPYLIRNSRKPLTADILEDENNDRMIIYGVMRPGES